MTKKDFTPTSRKIIDITDPNWDGSYSFSDLYAIKFINLSGERSLVTSMHSGNAIHLVNFRAKDRHYIVTCSTLPGGRTPKDELNIQLKRIQSDELSINVKRFKSNLGDGVSGNIVNPCPSDIFPLEISLYKPEAGVHSKTVSSYRLIIKDGSRIEVLVLISSSSYSSLEKAIKAVDVLADKLFLSLVNETLPTNPDTSSNSLNALSNNFNSDYFCDDDFNVYFAEDELKAGKSLNLTAISAEDACYLAIKINNQDSISKLSRIINKEKSIDLNAFHIGNDNISTCLLLSAIESNNFEIVNFLISKEISVYNACKNFSIELSAQKTKNTKIINLISSCLGDRSKIYRSWIVNTVSAIKIDDSFAFKDLLSQVADHYKWRTHANGCTLLAVAAQEGSLNCMRELLSCKNKQVNQVLSTGYTALMYAVLENKIEAVKLLIDDRSLDIGFIGGSENLSALGIAIKKNYKEIEDLLTGTVFYRKKLISDSVYGAIKSNNAAEIKNIYKVGTFINDRLSSGYTALTYAIHLKADASFEYLISRSDVNINQSDSSCLTPIFCCVRNNNINAFKKLIALKADLKITINGTSLVDRINKKDDVTKRLFLDAILSAVSSRERS